MDTHGSEVVGDVWDLLDKAYEAFGVFPTLLERDFNFPELDSLLGEVGRIRDSQVRAAAPVQARRSHG